MGTSCNDYLKRSTFRRSPCLQPPHLVVSPAVLAFPPLLPPLFRFSVQLQVYRPLVERADSIDRRRAEAEEGLRAAAAEVVLERECSAAAKQEAAQLRLRFAEAEAEVTRINWWMDDLA